MSQGRLSGKVAVITGASRGIGRALAKGFAAEGATVVVSARGPKGTEAIAHEIREAGGVALPIAAEVGDHAQVEAVFAQAAAEFGRIDIAVANAGVPQVRASEEITPTEWQQMIDTNLSGVFYTCQAAGKRMLAQNHGAILVIGSVVSFTAFPQRLAYGTTKGGVLQLTRELAIEWASRGVRVNMLAPGYIKTDLMAGLIEKGLLDPSALIKRTPMQRLGEVEDLIGPSVFLVSDESRFVTGQSLVVDGGWLAYGYT